jgi:N-methylhydantoinase B
MGKNIDPVTLELVKNSINSIIDQMALSMNRTASTPLVRDLFDFATGLCNKDGEMIGEGLVNAIHSGVLPHFVQFLNELFEENIYPGDIFMCNDPYEGASHIPDVYTVRPIFIDDELVAFAGSIAHQLDFGGKTPGSNACDNTEIFQEGLRIPPLKYYERGVRNNTLYRLIEKNVRISEQVLGDLEAQVAATGIGERGLLELAQKYGGWRSLSVYLEELLDYTERLTRAAILELPDGEYEYEDWMDDDGFEFEPIRFHAKITVRGDEMVYDFTGSSPAVKGSINLPLSSTIACVNTSIRLLLDPYVPANSGVVRPITLIAPYGTIVNVGFPRAVAGRGATLGRLFDVITGALCQIVPDKIPATSSNVDFGICLGGTHLDGKPFVMTDFLAGSWGGRPFADGIDAHTPIWLNYSNLPVETVEAKYPILIEEYSFVQDSGGAGKYRGGMAYAKSYRFLTDDTTCQWRQDRALFPPKGFQGGKDGSPAKGYHTSQGKTRELKKETFVCRKGDTLRAVLPGAAGFGDPFERDPESVLNDVRDEKISLVAAKNDYGVVIDPEKLTLDRDATEELRKKKGRVEYV